MEYERLSTDTAAQLKQGYGLDYVRALSCVHEGVAPLEERFPARFPLSHRASAFRQKAATPAGTPSDSTFAGPLTVVRPSQTEFVALVRAATLLARIPGLRLVPFNVSVPVVTTGGAPTGGSGRVSRSPSANWTSRRCNCSLRKPAAF